MGPNVRFSSSFLKFPETREAKTKLLVNLGANPRGQLAPLGWVPRGWRQPSSTVVVRIPDRPRALSRAAMASQKVLSKYKKTPRG